jgi:hypothetical protein
MRSYGSWKSLPSFQEADSFEVETDQNQKIWSSVSSLVVRGQNQSFVVLVYSVEATDLNQNPGALTFVYAVEEKDLNQRLSGSHLGRKKSSKCDSR